MFMQLGPWTEFQIRNVRMAFQLAFVGSIILLSQLCIANIVKFPDPNLELKIREFIQKPSGDILSDDLLSLTVLDAPNSGISDLTGLEYCLNLCSLSLQGNQINNIQPLAGLKQLGQLILNANRVSDISVVSGLPLWGLHLGGNPIRDFSPIFGLTGLKQLNMNDCNISDIQFLSRFTELSFLHILNNQIKDISPLSELTHLTSLALSVNPFTNINPLKNLTDLELLWIDNVQISNYSLLGTFVKLKELGASNCGIQDISWIKNLPLLEVLRLGKGEWEVNNSNKIYDISPLASLTHLSYLSLGNNLVSNIKPLVDNPGIGTGDVIWLQDNPLSFDSIDNMIPILINRGAKVIFGSYTSVSGWELY